MSPSRPVPDFVVVSSRAVAEVLEADPRAVLDVVSAEPLVDPGMARIRA